MLSGLSHLIDQQRHKLSEISIVVNRKTTEVALRSGLGDHQKLFEKYLTNFEEF